MRKKIAAAGVALTLAGGGAGLALFGPSTALAADSASSSQTATEGTRPDPKARQAEALQPLIDDGTITQAQADAVIAALEEARPQGTGPGGGPRGRGPGLEAVATAIGIDATALRTELESDKTIAEVAADNGVEVQVVVDAIVADMQSHLAEAV
jgi:hypothetical protein